MARGARPGAPQRTCKLISLKARLLLPQNLVDVLCDCRE